LREIGVGGMGVVYEAQQQEPVRRRVALKVIKWGMDTKEFVTRFESERQALALMNHPNIASVHDAGATETGRPYFVMEFVPGIPSTRYCDKHRLNLRERLKLFIQACEGVQHAHQKGIIHRDIKPSNVLVADQDERAVPKIIDFGVAKATYQRLTQKTVYTELGQLIGTPEYMSPEQAELSGLDIDTRTDVYSLGVLLYELLVGAQPFDPTELRRAGFDGLRTIISEDQPPKPSTRLHSLGKGAPDSAKNRRVELPILVRQLRGDLDWITMKSLEKDRTRRYGSPSEFAADIRRHLNHEPVLARPPSTLYRAGKFTSRHKAGVTAAAGFVGLLIGVVVLTLVQSAQIAKGRDRAEQAREEVEEVVEFMVDLFEVSDPMESPGDTITAREILDRGAERIDSELDDRPLTKARMLQTIGRVYQSLGLYEEAEQPKEEALAIRRRELGNEHPDVAHSLDSLASLAYERADYDSAEASSRESLSIYRQLHGEEHADIAGALSDLGVALSEKGELESTERVQREALEMARGLPDVDDKSLEIYVRRLAITLAERGEFEEVEPLYRESLELSRKVYGQEHPRVAMALDNLAMFLNSSDDYVRAEPLYRESLAMLRRVYGTASSGRADDGQLRVLPYLLQRAFRTRLQSRLRGSGTAPAPSARDESAVSARSPFHRRRFRRSGGASAPGG
jgi:serine/threonine protein kinase/Flp pilus assembly protein TadD